MPRRVSCFDVALASVTAWAARAVLLIEWHGLRSAEKDSFDDYRHYAVVTKAIQDERTDFSSLKPG